MGIVKHIIVETLRGKSSQRKKGAILFAIQLQLNCEKRRFWRDNQLFWGRYPPKNSQDKERGGR
jgi:hypothetical protein